MALPSSLLKLQGFPMRVMQAIDVIAEAADIISEVFSMLTRAEFGRKIFCQVPEYRIPKVPDRFREHTLVRHFD